MNKYKKLFGDSIIYFLGNIGSKVISVVMVSFYSFMLLPEEFGKIDITQTTISLILPFTTLCIHEAVLRFCLKSEYGKDSILANGILLECISFLFCIPITLLLNAFNLIAGNVILIIFLIVLEGVNTLFSQYCRGINKVKLFATAGIILTFVMAACNILFLKYLRLGINGYFLSMIVGYIVSVGILFFGAKLYKSINFRCTDKKLIRIMIKYSIPLIPNSIMWWLMNAADKYVIMVLLGTEANGLYAVAGKFPMIISTITTIFMQAWQVSAISESDSEDKNDFYSKIFDGLSSFMMIVICGILIVFKPALTIIINTNYTDIWKYVPFLFLSTMFSSFSAFLGTNYSAMAKTSGALKTTLIGSVLNVILNFVLIHFIGLNGAAIATAITFLVIWLLRVDNTKQFVTIKIDKVKFFLSLIMIGSQIACVYLFNDLIIAIYGVFVLAGLLLLNMDLIKKIIGSVTKKKV